ncbi:putative peptidase S26, lexA/Signal peptidase-like superfamily [Helianthus debilis subsp. tardiflorus]
MVHGPSMLPTFDLTNEIVLLDRISTQHGNAGPNDVVILQSPEIPKTFLTKGNIGVEDDGVTYLVDPRNSDVAETLAI